MLPNVDMRTHLRLIKEFEGLILQHQDSGRDAWVAWMQADAQRRVNLERMQRSLGPVDLDFIERIERTAMGHIDYTHKFAIRLAEAAQGVR